MSKSNDMEKFLEALKTAIEKQTSEIPSLGYGPWDQNEIRFSTTLNPLDGTTFFYALIQFVSAPTD